MKPYPAEFRSRVLRDADALGVKPACRLHGVIPNTIRRWRSEEKAEHDRGQSRAAKDKRRVPCAHECGSTVRHDSWTGVCPACREAERQASLKHGTMRMYARPNNCRCSDCRRANTERQREARRITYLASKQRLIGLR